MDSASWHTALADKELECTENTVFQWPIYVSRDMLEREGTVLLSPEFVASGATWQLELRSTRSSLVSYVKFPTFHLKPLVIKCSISANVTFYILRNGEEQYVKRSLKNQIFGFRKKNAICVTTASNFEEIRNCLSSGGNLTAVVEIKTNAMSCISQAPPAKKPKTISESYREVAVNLNGLLNSEKFSDVKFIIGGKCLYAHKNILANKSSVFAAMFEHQMKENIENVVEISDFDYDVFLELLRFIYTGRVDNIANVVKDLLVAADKYDLMDLKAIISGWLCNSLALNNAIDYLNFSRQYHIEELESQALGFILSNSKSMMVQPEFDNIVGLDPDVVLKIIRGLILNSK